MISLNIGNGYFTHQLRVFKLEVAIKLKPPSFTEKIVQYTIIYDDQVHHHIEILTSGALSKFCICQTSSTLLWPDSISDDHGNTK